MNVPFNDTTRLYQKLASEINQSMQAVAASGRWLQGDATEKFAANFSHYIGVKYALPVANGTDALVLALRYVRSLYPTETVEIITVANAGGYTTTACYLADVLPVYVDIQQERQTICLTSLLKSITPSVKAIVLTHLYGMVVDVPEIRRQLAEKGRTDILLIEDCAQSHGATCAGQKVGSLGDLAAFSFYPTKNLGAMGDAGALLTSNADIYVALKRLAQYGWQQKYTIVDRQATNSRMDELQAAILSVFLPYLDEMNTLRSGILRRYQQAAPASIRFAHQQQGEVVHLAVVSVKERQDFIQHLKAHHIATDIHYPILDHDQPAWKDLPASLAAQTKLLHSKQSVQNIVSLPCFPTMTTAEIDMVCQALSTWQGEG